MMMTVGDVIDQLSQHPRVLPFVYFALDSLALAESSSAGYDSPVRVSVVTIKPAIEGLTDFQRSTSSDPGSFNAVSVL